VPGANPPCRDDGCREEPDAGASRGSGEAAPVGICESELTGAAQDGQNRASEGTAA
jgi:hypothetical protein